jgi:uncharacterized membrane protein YebE (DUF533 family)
MDINRLIDGFLGGSGGGMAGAAESAKRAMSGGSGGGVGAGVGGGVGGGLAGGALAGGAMALLLGTKKGRKMGGAALKYGGIAAVGGLAYMAYRNYKNSQNNSRNAGTPAPAPTPAQVRAIPAPPADSGFAPEALEDQRGRDFRLTLVQAMIAAANADGHIDGDEHARIAAQIDQMDLAGDEKAFLFDCMRAPSDPIAIATLAMDEAQSAEVYLASLLAIDPDTPQEQRYMDRLGDALRLPDALRAELSNHVAAARAEGTA